MASRPKLLRSAPEDFPDVDEQIDDDETSATERARTARRRPPETVTPLRAPAPPAPQRRPPAAKQPRTPRSSSSSRSSSRRPTVGGGGVVHDGAGVLLGMFTYALFLAYVKGGWAGVTGWLSAKFLNKTAEPAAVKQPATGGATNWNNGSKGYTTGPGGISTPPSSTDPAGNPNVKAHP